MTAWVDYVDARRRLLHEWQEQGVAHDEMAVRIELDEQRVANILVQPADPPFPGSARHQVLEWKRRCAELEAELHAVGAVPSEPPPLESMFRSLRLHPDAEVCGCQYWTEHPRIGQHHPQCEHARVLPSPHADHREAPRTEDPDR